MTILPDRLHLLRAIRADPSDLAPWLAYSDWLREQGHDEEAAAAASRRMLISAEERRVLAFFATVTFGNSKHARFLGELNRSIVQEGNGWGRKRLTYKQWLFIWQIVWTYRAFMPFPEPTHEFVQLAEEYTRRPIVGVQ